MYMDDSFILFAMDQEGYFDDYYDDEEEYDYSYDDEEDNYY